MEHLLQQWSEEQGILLSSKQIETLYSYARILHDENQKYNLTGCKNIKDIINNLLIGSLSPVRGLNVPRGTLFADIGSGSGIPGIPFGILFEQAGGILIDSNHKKTDFINLASGILGLKNIKGINGRIEELDGSYKESFDLIFSRALGNPYLVSEISAPYLKLNGLLYIYAHQTTNDLPKDIIDHAQRVGLHAVPLTEHGFTDNGFLFKKEIKTPALYPRRFAIIKREAKKYIEI